MKFVYLLAICALGMVAMVTAQDKKFQLPPPDNKLNLPTITGGVGGSRKQGFDVSIDANQRVWQSPNRHHSVDVSVGHSQHLGGPYGSSRPDRRFGVGYKYNFG